MLHKSTSLDLTASASQPLQAGYVPSSSPHATCHLSEPSWNVQANAAFVKGSNSAQPGPSSFAASEGHSSGVSGAAGAANAAMSSSEASVNGGLETGLKEGASVSSGNGHAFAGGDKKQQQQGQSVRLPSTVRQAASQDLGHTATRQLFASATEGKVRGSLISQACISKNFLLLQHLYMLCNAMNVHMCAHGLTYIDQSRNTSDHMLICTHMTLSEPKW